MSLDIIRSAKTPATSRYRTAVLTFLRQSFQDVSTTIATVIGLLVILLVVIPFIRWGIVNGNFAGNQAADCSGSGACWSFIRAKMGVLIYGYYPSTLAWQVNLAVVLLIVGNIAAFALARRFQVAAAAGAYLLSIFLGFKLFGGQAPGMTEVDVERWGGLALTLLLFVIGMGISFLLGGLLALGRRSSMVLFRSVSIVYVEFMRGVPLIAILFIAVVMFPLFLPGGADMNMVLRVVAGICLYTSAYMAEAIRAGLDAVPDANREAAHALGLSPWNTLKLVVFPQALSISMPGIVNTLIALVKDTSLVVIVGLHDFLGATQLAAADVKWGNVLWEAYVFAGLVYFIFCFLVARLGTEIEKRLTPQSGNR